jgi:glycosyltransferase involved in cell wall biosynthesis
LITKNEEANISRTLRSIHGFASEIIIVDSGSTDNTETIALEYNAKFFSEEWKGFASQKNSALGKCTQTWILCIDADEVPDEKFKAAVESIINSDSPYSYKINIKSYYLGKLLNHCWQPEWKLRLVRRDANPKWLGDEVHESIITDNDVRKCEGSVIHYSYRDVEHHKQKIELYSELSAKAMQKMGKTAGILNLILNPAINFLKMYIILQRGFLDGYPGYMASIISSKGTYLKYKKLRKLNKDKKI